MRILVLYLSHSLSFFTLFNQASDEKVTTAHDVQDEVAGSSRPKTEEEEDDEEEEEEEGQESTSALSGSLRLRAPLSPRTTEETIRLRSKFRRRHSSGSDDSINLSQNGWFLSFIKKNSFYCCLLRG